LAVAQPGGDGDRRARGLVGGHRQGGDGAGDRAAGVGDDDAELGTVVRELGVAQGEGGGGGAADVGEGTAGAVVALPLVAQRRGGAGGDAEGGGLALRRRLALRLLRNGRRRALGEGDLQQLAAAAAGQVVQPAVGRHDEVHRVADGPGGEAGRGVG